MRHYRKDIDGLRALAILAVVLFHVFPKGLRGGFVGVDIFFVISGYLIAGIIDRDIKAHRFSLLNFYDRRARRIFPALMLVLAFVMVIGAAVLLPGEYRQLGLHVAGGVGFIENFVLWQEAGYFDGASEGKPLLHLWSLAVEEQFYLLFPLLLLVLDRCGQAVTKPLLLLAAFSFGAGLYDLKHDASAAFFLPQNRVWELLLGAGIALSGWSRRLVAYPILLEGLSILGFLLLIGVVVGVRREMGFPGYVALFPVLATGLLLVSGPKTYLHRTILSSRGLVGLGLISYPLYLWHWVLLALGHTLVPTLTGLGRLALVGLSLFLAVLTTRYVEQPIRFGAPLKPPVSSLWALMVLIGILGIGLFTLDGIPSRFEDPRQRMAFNFASDHKGPDESCIGALRGLGFCRRIGTDDPEMALIGDSHSLHLVDGLKGAGLSFWLLGRAGCPPFLDSGLGGNQCPKGSMNPAFEAVLRRPGIKTVVIAGRFGLYWHGQIPAEGRASTNVDFPLLGPRGDSNPMVFKAQAEATVKALLAQGKRIVWVLDVPELGFDPHECLRRPDWLSRPEEHCGISEDSYEERSKDYRSALKAISQRYQGVDIWDPKNRLCHNGFCGALTPTEVLYQDDDHLTIHGSRRLGPYLAENLRQHNSMPALNATKGQN